MTDRDKSPDRKPRIDTMQDLSRAIGVSRPTLSRYFQDPERVSRTSQDRIKKGLDRVEYVPNFFATRMNRKTTSMIGVITPYLNDLFFSQLLEAIERAAMNAGFTVIAQCSHSDPDIEARAIETLLSMNVDGAIVVPLGNHSDLHAYERLRDRLPMVLADSRPHTLAGVDFVGTDHMQSTGLVLDYLCRVGEPPVFLAMPRVNFNALERERAYIARMKERGHTPVVLGVDPVEGEGFYECHGLAVMDSYFSRGELVDRSILCVNDRVAIGALRAAAQHGLEPGAQRRGGLRIAGHDGYPLCPFTTPPLTTVAQNVDGIGHGAVARLAKKIRAEKKTGDEVIQLFNGEMFIRQSA